MRFKTALRIIASLALAGCAYQAPPIANPGALPPTALGLYDAVLNGCIPYVRGEKSEQAAMAAIGFARDTTPQNPLTSPDYDHRYEGRMPSLVRVSIPARYHEAPMQECVAYAHGDTGGTYRGAAERAFTQRFGADFAAQAPRYPKPDTVYHHGDFQFCRDGLLIDAFATFQDMGRTKPSYEVTVQRAWVTPGVPAICG